MNLTSLLLSPCYQCPSVSSSSSPRRLSLLLLCFPLLLSLTASTPLYRSSSSSAAASASQRDMSSLTAVAGVLQPWLDHCKGAAERRLCEQCQVATGDARTYTYCCRKMHGVYEYCQDFVVHHDLLRLARGARKTSGRRR